jgi:hypothetical protein
LQQLAKPGEWVGNYTCPHTFSTRLKIAFIFVVENSGYVSQSPSKKVGWTGTIRFGDDTQSLEA